MFLVAQIQHSLTHLVKGFTRLIAPQRYKSLDTLVFWHFLSQSYLGHPNRYGLKLALGELRNNSALIVETGTSAWGCDSTRLWASYIKSFGGQLYSVDIRDEPRRKLGYLGSNVLLSVGDSVEFLQNFSKSTNEKIDLLYLDSFDVDWNEPMASAIHGFEEFESSLPSLKSGSIVIIDDTPNTIKWIPHSQQEEVRRFEEAFGFLPGKGCLVLDYVRKRQDLFQVIHHEYNLVIKVK